MDLSAIDPEGFDVSHIITTNNTYNETNDFSWNWLNNNKLEIKIPGSSYNGYDYSLVILAHDNMINDVSNLIPNTYYTDTIDLSKRIVKFKRVNRQPDWKYMKLSVSNEDLLLNDQSWNKTIFDNFAIDTRNVDISNQFYLHFDTCDNYIYSNMLNGSKDLSSYYLDLSALDFEGYDVSYGVSNVKGDLSWSWVDNSRIVIDISDTVVSGSDTSLQIISIDDWINRPNPEERIIEFKHISSQVINLFDISENAQSTLRNYNNSVNDYSFAYIRKHITIEPSYQSRYSTYFETYNDYSVNDITSSLGDTGTNVDIEIINSKIDVSTAIFDDISFSFILNNIFKYNFNLSPYVQFSYDGVNIINTGAYPTAQNPTLYFVKQFSVAPTSSNNSTSNSTTQPADVYTFVLTTTQTVTCYIDEHLKRMEVLHFIAGSGGGSGGRGNRFGPGGGGGGGASGFIVMTENDYDKKISSFEVVNFSNHGSGNGGLATSSKLNITMIDNNGIADSENDQITISNYITNGQGGSFGSGSSSKPGGSGGKKKDGVTFKILPASGDDGTNGGGGSGNTGGGGYGGDPSDIDINGLIDIGSNILDIPDQIIPSGGDGGAGGDKGNSPFDPGDNGLPGNSSSNIMIVRLIF